MSLDSPLLSACAADTAADLALARRRLAEASDRLGTVMRAAAELAARTDWQTPAARRFHGEVDAWCGTVGGLARGVEAADGDAWLLELRAMVRAGGGG